MSAAKKRPVGRPPKRIERIPATAQEILEAIFRAADRKLARPKNPPDDPVNV